MGNSFQTGPKFDPATRARLQGLDHSRSAAPTLKGWVLGLLSCALLSLIIPYVDSVIRCTRLTLNLLPATSVFLTMLFILGIKFGLARFSPSLGLSRQDLALIFGMTMLINPLPASGFLNYMVSEQMASFYYARPENNWAALIHPHLPEALFPRDPADPLSTAPRPVAWFFSGLPPGEKVPWAILAGPYIRWCLALVMVLGMFFSLCALLHRQWSDRERLSFPLAQVPEIMMGDLHRGGERRSFFLDKLTWWGIAATFLLHSWNATGDYVNNWAPIDLKSFRYWQYLTEPPYNHLTPLYMNIYPSVIGIMYLISLEVSFSLWFFYIIVLKIGILIAVLGFGVGGSRWYFDGHEGYRSIFTSQGLGAALAMVLISFVMARSLLWSSLKQALGLAPRDPGEESFSARSLWLLLGVCLVGSVLWLVGWAQVSWYWALIAVLILLVSSTAIARLVSEGGVFFLQMTTTPAQLMSSVFTPVSLGTQNYVMLSVWSRVFTFDYYRSCPMINIIGALHLGSLTNLKRRPLIFGLSAALLVTFTTAFYSFYHTAYVTPGGARQFGWVFAHYPHREFKQIANKVSRVEAYQEKERRYAGEGKEIPRAEIPNVAKTDWIRVNWMMVGAVAMAVFLFLRTRLFWWPHPIGYVMWMGMWPIHRMWFTYFLGWLIKLLVVKFGGQRVYLRWRNFFVGLIVGEALATALWLVVAWLSDNHDGYGMHYN